MRPEKLIISGWGPYKNRTEIDFTAFEGRGLFLVTGATGAGKTTIFDAITYALYGSLSGEMREKNSVRSDFADGDIPTFVELSMHHGGKAYRIVRNPEYTRPRKRGKSGAFTKEKENAVLYLPDGSILEGTREVNARMQEILVLDYTQFKQITMIAQGEFAKLLTASPRDKTRIFRDIFGTGIYERFGQALRARANTLYAGVMEQRHKLEEDVRLLLADRQAEEMTADLRRLTEGDNWNYGAVSDALQALQEHAVEREQALQAQCVRLQEKKDGLTGEVTRKRLENEQIERLCQAKELLDRLREQESAMADKKQLCDRARAAASLEPFRIKARSGAARLINAEQKRESLETERGKLLAEKKELAPLAEKKEELQRYLDISRQLMENREQEAACQKDYTAVCQKWEEAKSSYLRTEKVRDEKQKVYEEADRIYKHAVVGIAARLLQPGEPCPVCGSREHPAPAKEEQGLPSEAELKRLQKEYREAEAALQKEQNQAVSLKTLAEEQEKRLGDFREKTAVLDEAEHACGEGLFTEAIFAKNGFLQASYQEKAAFVQSRTERLTQLDAMVGAVENQLEEANREIQLGQQEQKASHDALAEALAKEGFASEEACEKALLSPKELRELEEQIAEYTRQRTAADSVKTHLEETLQNREKHDLSVLEEQVQECGRCLAEQQELLRTAHAFCQEVKKTAAQFAKQQKKMEKASAEYGYVKDLDNMASGNNARRLVFEQYVLAGYFEEILRAANLRFFKMTGGRYEMSRVEEAGDGRVKDSLEIQVMDYYTGKSRSVKTLSGGESFKASLSLALGMSDVIQAMNGGIKVDTLFVDEGFGALDGESLDQACETLMGLVEHNRLIGIISHVPELRERIDCQLVVEKTNSGSSVKIHV